MQCVLKWARDTNIIVAITVSARHIVSIWAINFCCGQYYHFNVAQCTLATAYGNWYVESNSPYGTVAKYIQGETAKSLVFICRHNFLTFFLFPQILFITIGRNFVLVLSLIISLVSLIADAFYYPFMHWLRDPKHCNKSHPTKRHQIVYEEIVETPYVHTTSSRAPADRHGKKLEWSTRCTSSFFMCSQSPSPLCRHGMALDIRINGARSSCIFSHISNVFTFVTTCSPLDHFASNLIHTHFDYHKVSLAHLFMCLRMGTGQYPVEVICFKLLLGVHW